jgi:hypothetical protein
MAAESPKQSGVPADYGDAPDERPTGYSQGAKIGRFPTRSSSNGARALHPERLWLGTPGSVERDVADATDLDGRVNLDYDSDDGLREMLLSLEQHPPLAAVTVETGARNVSTDVWLNVAVDLNGDGRWGGTGAAGEPEWAVQNHSVELPPEAIGRSRPVALPPFIYANGEQLPRQAWMRIAVTDRPIETLWDGTGQFEAGEIEDYFVELADSKLPLVTVDCLNPNTTSGRWGFNGAKHVSVSCSVTPFGANARQRFSFDIKRMTGGAAHSVMCGSTELDAGSNEERVQGVTLGQGPTEVRCLYKRTGKLPSEWEFAVPVGSAASRVTERGVELGHSSVVATTFVLERGECASKCEGGGACFGGRVCSKGCCVPPWAPECETRDPEACGRCCAQTGGARASDCVRQACAL